MELKKRTILYILHAYQNRGGTEEHTKMLAESILDEFRVVILARSGDEILLVENNEVQNRFPAPKLNWPITPLNDSISENILSQVISKLTPDIVHIQHFANWHLSLLEQIANFKIPIVLSLHDYYLLTPFFTNQFAASEATTSSEKSRAIFGGDITKYLQRREQYLSSCLTKINQIVVPSNYLKSTIENKFRCTCRIIEHGINEIEITNRNETNINFGYIGSLIPQKGWNVLKEAFRNIREKIPLSTLHFFGDGDNLNVQDKSDQSQIIFHGRYDRSELPKILSTFEIGIIPSIFEETFCLTLSELWQARKPVIVSDIGALGERVTHNLNGLKVLPNNTSQLSEAIVWFTENNTWKNWTLPTPRKASEMTEEYKNLYRSLLGCHIF